MEVTEVKAVIFDLGDGRTGVGGGAALEFHDDDEVGDEEDGVNAFGAAGDRVFEEERGGGEVVCGGERRERVF